MPVLFDIRDLSKVYRMGEVEVHALRDVSLSAGRGRVRVSCWARPAPANRRCSTSSAASTCRPRGHVLYRDPDLTQRRRSGAHALPPRHVGFVFQFYNLIPSLTARENVALVTEIVDAPDDARGGARDW